MRDHHGNWVGISEGKGKQGENCNRTACQEPKSALYQHKINQQYYCEDCTYAIEASAIRFGDGSYFDGLDPLKLRGYKG